MKIKNGVIQVDNNEIFIKQMKTLNKKCTKERRGKPIDTGK